MPERHAFPSTHERIPRTVRVVREAIDSFNGKVLEKGAAVARPEPAIAKATRLLHYG